MLQTSSIRHLTTVIPICRWILNNNRNTQIEQRNEARQQAAELLSGRTSPALSSKLISARREGQRRTVRSADVVFRSDQEAGPQKEQGDMDEWDRRLQGRAGGRRR